METVITRGGNSDSFMTRCNAQTANRGGLNHTETGNKATIQRSRLLNPAPRHQTVLIFIILHIFLWVSRLCDGRCNQNPWTLFVWLTLREGAGSSNSVMPIRSVYRLSLQCLKWKNPSVCSLSPFNAVESSVHRQKSIEVREGSWITKGLWPPLLQDGTWPFVTFQHWVFVWTIWSQANRPTKSKPIVN